MALVRWVQCTVALVFFRYEGRQNNASKLLIWFRLAFTPVLQEILLIRSIKGKSALARILIDFRDSLWSGSRDFDFRSPCLYFPSGNDLYAGYPAAGIDRAVGH